MMTRRWPDFNRPRPQPYGLTAWLPVAVLIAIGAFAVALIFYGFLTTRVHAACSSSAMAALAQEHSNDMARRDRLDHDGFAGRAARGARAENVAYGYATEAKTMAQWWRSPGHAANMRLPGCRAVASAVSRSGRKFWTMEIGQR
jgi:hypothetical protein